MHQDRPTPEPSPNTHPRSTRSGCPGGYGALSRGSEHWAVADGPALLAAEDGRMQVRRARESRFSRSRVEGSAFATAVAEGAGAEWPRPATRRPPRIRRDGSVSTNNRLVAGPSVVSNEEQALRASEGRVDVGDDAGVEVDDAE